MSPHLDPLDGHEDGALVAADIVHLRLPHLPEVPLAQHLGEAGRIGRMEIM